MASSSEYESESEFESGSGSATGAGAGAGDGAGAGIGVPSGRACVSSATVAAPAEPPKAEPEKQPVAPKEEKVERRKYGLWQHLLKTSHVLHCFPPESMPEDKRVVMGSKEHIHGEVVFDQRQGLWFMARGWEAAIAAPKEKDFFRWLAQQHNGLRAGQAVPPA